MATDSMCYYVSMKKIAILGSTGSIGTNALNVVRHLSDNIKVTALAAGSNLALIRQQIVEFRPKLVAIYDEGKAKELQTEFPELDIIPGMEGLIAVATHTECEMVISAITGAIGLQPTIAAIRAGKTIGLANKEVLVAGGEYVMALAKENNVPIIPIDSEHSALFQALNGEAVNNVRRMILTASGGPFRNFSDDQLASINLEQALKHPSWSMGPKITIDSSTLMNKGLEVIEARWLFDLPVENIDVIIHPQSVIHSMIEYVDGSIMAQMSEPSMIIPIQYAITYPERLPGLLKPFDFTKYSKLEFFQPDFSKFRCLHLAFESLKLGGSAPCYLNAANEALVELFLAGKTSWLSISQKLEALLENYKPYRLNSLEDILTVDAEARRKIME